MNPEIIIIGAGGHGRVIADIVKSAGDTVLGFLDDGVAGSNICGRILGTVSDCIKSKTGFLLLQSAIMKCAKIFLLNIRI